MSLMYDDEGFAAYGPVGGSWHTISVEDPAPPTGHKAVHLFLQMAAGRISVVVGPQSDARLSSLFGGQSAEVVRAALEENGARPGTRKLVYIPVDEMDCGQLLIVEDHALYEDRKDMGELLVTFSPAVIPNIVDTLSPDAAEVIRGMHPWATGRYPRAADR